MAEEDLRSLLDSFDATETLDWLLPLDDEPQTLDARSGEPPRAARSNRPPQIAPVQGAAGREKPPTGPERLPSDPNRARSERRLELIHLRRQVAELEAQLGQLNMSTTDGRRLRTESHRASAQTSLQVVRTSMHPSQRSTELWEELAWAEKNKRARAETENTRLRLLVDSHVKTSNQLRRILVPKRPRNARSLVNACFKEHDSDKLLQASPRTSRPFTGFSHSPSSEIFDMLKHSVMRARKEMDAVFIANGLATMEKNFRSAKVEEHDAGGTMMELAASKVLPYDLESTRRVAWHHFIDAYPQFPDRTSFHYHGGLKDVGVDGRDDMLAASYTYEVGNGFVSGKFDEWRVIQQFAESDRAIIIYCIVCEVKEFASKPVTGIRILMSVYIVIRCTSKVAARKGGRNASRSRTVVQSYYRFQPIQYEATPGLEDTFAAVTDFMFGYIGGRISLNYQMIEQKLQASAGLF